MLRPITALIPAEQEARPDKLARQGSLVRPAGPLGVVVPNPGLEVLVGVGPVNPPAVRTVLDHVVDDAGQAVPAVLPLGARGGGGAVGVDFDTAGHAGRDFAAIAGFGGELDGWVDVRGFFAFVVAEH